MFNDFAQTEKKNPKKGCLDIGSMSNISLLSNRELCVYNIWKYHH